MASKGGEGDDSGGGDRAAENNDNTNNDNNNNGINGEASESPAAPAAKKSLMSALKPEEIKEKAKEKANLMQRSA